MDRHACGPIDETRGITQSDKTMAIRGGIKKNKLVFFRKTPKGGRGGLAQSEISLSEKNRIFLDFFSKGGGLIYSKKVL